LPFNQQAQLVEINSATTFESSETFSTPPASSWMNFRPVLVGNLAVLHA